MLGSSTCLPLEATLPTVPPRLFATCTSGVALWYLPWASNVAYAFVISSGLTATLPSVTAQASGSLDLIPRRCAISTTLSGPSWAITCANTVLTECSVAPRSVKVPASPSPAFTTCHGPVGPAHTGFGIVIADGPCQYRDTSEYPFSSAAASVNALNAEPDSRPLPPCSVARLSFDLSKLRPPTIARIWPVRGSIETTAAEGLGCPSESVGGRSFCTASHAAFCMDISMLVFTCRPPPYTRALPYLLNRYWRA